MLAWTKANFLPVGVLLTTERRWNSHQAKSSCVDHYPLSRKQSCCLWYLTRRLASVVAQHGDRVPPYHQRSYQRLSHLYCPLSRESWSACTCCVHQTKKRWLVGFHRAIHKNQARHRAFLHQRFYAYVLMGPVFNLAATSKWFDNTTRAEFLRNSDRLSNLHFLVLLQHLGDKGYQKFVKPALLEGIHLCRQGGFYQIDPSWQPIGLSSSAIVASSAWRPISAPGKPTLLKPVLSTPLTCNEGRVDLRYKIALRSNR